MAGLEDMIRSSAPGGNIGKPLILALLALLASGALFRSGGGERPADTQPKSDEGAGGLLGGLGGLLDKLQKGGLGNAANSWVGSSQKSARIPWATWLGPWPGDHQDTSSTLRPLRRRNYQAVVTGTAGRGGQADPAGPSPNCGGIV